VYLFCITEQNIERERERSDREREREPPAPWLDELELEAMSMGDGMSVVSEGGGWRSFPWLSANPRSGRVCRWVDGNRGEPHTASPGLHLY
jgi:hypothetical protein